MAEINLSQQILGMMALNSNGSHNNKGLPSPSQLVDGGSTAFAYNIMDEFKYAKLSGEIGDYSQQGFNLFMAIQYRVFIVGVSNNWDYNDGFIEDLGLDKYEIEEFLFQDSRALIRDNGKYFLLSFSPVEENVYKKPIRIKIENANEYGNGREFGEDEFVVMKNNPLQGNKIIENSSWFHIAYMFACMGRDNIFNGQEHYLYLNNPETDPNGQITATAISDFANSRKTVLSIFPKMLEAMRNGSDPDDRVGADMFENFKNSLLKLEYKDRLDILYDGYCNAMNEAYAVLGIPINSNEKKRERQITGEIDIQQAIPESQRAGMLYCRDIALQRANKKGGTSGAIEEKQQETEEQEVNENEPSEE